MLTLVYGQDSAVGTWGERTPHMSPVRLGILVTPWASLPLQPLPCLLTLSLGPAVYAEIPPTFPPGELSL